MRRCPTCDISYAGALEQCPLCGCALKGEAVPSTYPASSIVAPKRFARRVLAAITAACLVLVVALGIVVAAGPLVITAACAAVLLNYAFLRNIVVHAPDFIRAMERYFLVLFGVALLIVVATGWKALAAFAMPLLCLFAIFSNGVLVLSFRDRFVQAYAKYLFYDVVLGFVPLLLMAFGYVTWPALAIASAVGAVSLFLLMLVLTRLQLKAEARKLFDA